MSLTNFVASKKVREKFDLEFVNPSRNRINYYKKSKDGGYCLKENVGISIFGVDGNIKIICDSYERYRIISSLDDIIGFLSKTKYRDKLCWFYCSPSDFRSILQFFTETQQNDLFLKHETDYFGYSVQFQENRHIIIQNKSQKNKYFNLFPILNGAQESISNYELFKSAQSMVCQKSLDYDTEYCDKKYYDAVKSCQSNAVLIKKLADHYTLDIKNLEKNISRKIINEPKTNHYPTIGTAFDYLLRFMIEAEYPPTITQQWLAYKPMYFLSGKEKKMATIILEKAEEDHSHYLKTKEVSTDLIKSAINLSKLDDVYRTGLPLDENSMNIDGKDIEDMLNLIAGVPKDLLIPKEICILNPCFGLASDLVRGADADILIDNTLIDIKTTKYYGVNKEYLNQLFGYVLLHRLGLIYLNNIQKVDPEGNYDEMDWKDLDGDFLTTEIKKIGIYFPRFNRLETMDLCEIIPEGKIDWKMLAWFEHEAHKQCEPYSLHKLFTPTIKKKLESGKITLEDLTIPNKPIS